MRAPQCRSSPGRSVCPAPHPGLPGSVQSPAGTAAAAAEKSPPPATGLCPAAGDPPLLPCRRALFLHLHTSGFRLSDSALAQTGLLLMMVASSATHLVMLGVSTVACVNVSEPEDRQYCLSSIGNTLHCHRKAGLWAGPHLTTLGNQNVYRPAQHLSAVGPLPGLHSVLHLDTCLLRLSGSCSKHNGRSLIWHTWGVAMADILLQLLHDGD